MKPEDQAPNNDANQTHQGAMYTDKGKARNIPISEANESAATAAALASASRAAEDASAAAMAEAAKRRALNQAAANRAAASQAAEKLNTSAEAPISDNDPAPISPIAPGTIPDGAITSGSKPTESVNHMSTPAATATGREHMATDPISAVNSAQTATKNHPQKVGKGFIAALIILGVATVAAVICVVWFFCFYNQANNVVLDSIQKTLTAENISTKGSIAYESDSLNYSGDFEIASSKSTGVGVDATIEVEDTSTTDTYKFSVGAIASADDSLFFNVSGVVDALEGYLTNVLVVDSDVLETSDEESTTVVDEYTYSDILALDPSLQALDDIANQIDGQWWGITAEDGSSNAALTAYTCVSDILTTEVNVNKLVDLYSKYQFLTAKEYSNNVISAENPYTVSIDAAALASYVNAAYSDVIYPSLNTCVAISDASNEITIASADSEILNQEDAESIANFVNNLILDIDQWSHKLEGVYYVDSFESSDGTTAKIAVVSSVSFPESITINEPEEYQSADELIQIIVGMFTTN